MEFDPFGVRFVDTCTVRQRDEREAHSIQLDFSPDSSYLATVNRDGGPVRLWDPRALELVHEVGDRVSTFAFSPNGRLLLTCGAGYATVWEVPAMRKTLTVEVENDQFRANPAVCGFDQTGLYFAAGGGGYAEGLGWFGCWNANVGDRVSRGQLDSDKNEIGVSYIGADEHGRFCAWTAGRCEYPCEIGVIDLHTGLQIAEQEFDAFPFLFPPSYTAAYADSGQQLVFLDLMTGQQQRSCCSFERGADIRRMPSGKRFVWTTDDGRLTVYDPDQQMIVSETHFRQKVAPSLGRSHKHDVFATVINFVKWPGSPDETVFWNAGSSVAIARTTQHLMHCHNYVFSPDGKWFASGATVHASMCDDDRTPPGTIMVTKLGGEGGLPAQ